MVLPERQALKKGILKVTTLWGKLMFRNEGVGVQLLDNTRGNQRSEGLGTAQELKCLPCWVETGVPGVGWPD